LTGAAAETRFDAQAGGQAAALQTQEPRPSFSVSLFPTSEALLQDALDDGGSDNVTIVIGRPVRRD